jgi:hypothetical protein
MLSQTDAPLVSIHQRFGGARLRQRWRQGLWILPLTTVLWVQGGAQLREALWAIVGASATAVALYPITGWILSRSSLAIVNDCIVRSSVLTRTKSCSRAAVVQVVEAPMVVTRLSPITETYLLFLGQDNRVLIRAHADYYAAEELLRFREALGVPWQRTLPLTVAEARRALPGSFPWVFAHPWLILLVSLAAVLTLTAAVPEIVATA